LGEAKRRKQSDPNYGKAPQWKILEPGTDNYLLLEPMAEKIYSDLSNVFRLQIDYPNGETSVGLMHMYIDKNKKEIMCSPGTWTRLNEKSQTSKHKSGVELANVVMKPLIKIFQDRIK
jgi:hypothetical protein